MRYQDRNILSKAISPYLTINENLEDNEYVKIDHQTLVHHLKKLNLISVEEPNEPTILYPSIYHYIVEKYVNGYEGFNKELRKPKSFIRENLHIPYSENFLISTSLNLRHAFRYAIGSKGPSKTKKSHSQTLTNTGFVDVIFIPEEKLTETGAFFVLEEYAKGNIRINSHFHKNLITEEEVIFPLFISKAYVKGRFNVFKDKEKQFLANVNECPAPN